jgi:hypothetical protein
MGILFTPYAATIVLDKREARSRLEAGIVFFEGRGLNQQRTLVFQCLRANLMRKRMEKGSRVEL